MNDHETSAKIRHLMHTHDDMADEIERLRAALLEIRDAGPMTVDDQRWRIARAALETPTAKRSGGTR